MAKAQKNRASKQAYVSPTQTILEGFETPFHKTLDPTNRWVVKAQKIPWDMLVSVYTSRMHNCQTGADGINPRVAIGAMIIKHTCNLDDRETVQQIRENIYMQYFIGYSSFSNEAPFDPSLFVDFRKRLGMEQINDINEKIVKLSQQNNPIEREREAPQKQKENDDADNTPPAIEQPAPNGKVIVDATACPQDISYPTDLNLLNDAREKSEELITVLFAKTTLEKKPRTYCERARKLYLQTAQKKNKSKKEIRSAIKKQIGFLRRNITHLHTLLNQFHNIPLNKYQYKYLLVIQTLYEQQNQMYQTKTHSIAHRIVSIHQPHVRPIVRGKTNANVEFGAKINVSLMNGFVFLDDLQWEAYNEGTRLKSTVEKYKQRFGYYPKQVLADKIYCTRENRMWLKGLGIELRAKPLGRPTAVSAEHVSPGERNPIEGKFGQAKTAYGMNRIKARLSQTSQSWIATIIMVLNLVKLAGQVPFCLLVNGLTLTARCIVALLMQLHKHYLKSENQNTQMLRLT